MSNQPETPQRTGQLHHIMKRTILLIALTALFMTTVFTSCTKDKEQYTLTFTASHHVTEENMYCDPSAYYGWSVEDKDYNYKFDKSGYVVRETISETTTAESGDWIFIYVSVNDVFDYGSVSCKSSDGSISLYANTDNMYIDESDSETLKHVIVNDKDTIIKVKEMKFQLK
jgi:hypothetical protein